MNAPRADKEEMIAAEGDTRTASAAFAAQSHYRRQVDLRRRKALDLLLASAFIFSILLLVLVIWVTLRPGGPVRNPTANRSKTRPQPPSHANP